MKKNLRSLKRNNTPVFVCFFITLFVVITQLATAQSPPHPGQITAASSDTLFRDGMPTVELMWISITVVFSYLLNLFLRHGEKQPIRNKVEQRIFELAQQSSSHELANSLASNTEQNRRVAAGKGNYRHIRYLQPIDRRNILATQRKRHGVAS
jgi:hypothetical protein